MTDRNRENLINKLIDNLESCFPDGGIISSFSILDPQNLPCPSDLAIYGNQDIDTLSLHYGASKETADGVEQEPPLNGPELTEEWLLFKQMMSNKFSGSSIKGMAKRLLTSDEAQEQFPQILKLLTLALAVSFLC